VIQPTGEERLFSYNQSYTHIMQAIEVSHLTKQFGKLTALNDVNF